MFKIQNLLLAVLLLSAQQSLAQLEKDAEGNPVVTQQFVEEVIQPMEFQTIDGEPLKITDFDGKLVVIDFWQTWCGPCLRGLRLWWNNILNKNQVLIWDTLLQP